MNENNMLDLPHNMEEGFPNNEHPALILFRPRDERYWENKIGLLVIQLL